MSNLIEKNVVEMDFDNSKFEKNVKESMSTIDKLKQALKFEESKEALTSFAKQLDNLDFSGLEESIETIKNRFTNLGIVGATVVSRITNDVISGISNITRSITGMISQGGLSRAMNIEKAKFQLEGLGIAWETVKEDIDYGVKDTAYGLDAAANAAAQLATSQVELGKDMKQALRAISGVASMTGSSYEDISQIFTRAASNGRVMGYELTMLSSRGINAAAELGKALGKTEAEIRDMASKGQIDFKTFAKAMDDAFGQHAKDSNKTLTGTLSNIRAAYSRIGADFYNPIIRNEGELVDFLNAYRIKINEVKSALEPVAELTTGIINNIIKNGTKIVEGIDVKTRVENASYAIGSLINAFKLLWPRIAYFGRQIKGVFQEIFPQKEVKDFKSKIDSIVGHISSFNFTNKTIEKAKSIFRGLFSVANAGIKVFKNLLVFLKPLGKYIASQASNMLNIAAIFGDLLTKIFSGTVELEDFQLTFEKLTADIAGYISNMRDGFSSLLDVFKDDEKGAKDAIDAIVKIFTNGVQTILTVIGDVTGLDFSGLIARVADFSKNLNYYLRTLYDVYSNAGGGVKGFAVVIETVLSDIGKKITDFIEETTGIDLSELKDKISKWLENAKAKIEDFTSKVESPLKKLGEVFDFVKGRVKELEETLHGLGQKAAIGLGKILESPIASLAAFKGIGTIVDAIKKLTADEEGGGGIGQIPKLLMDIKDSISAFMSQTSAKTIFAVAAALLAFSYSLNVFAGSVTKLSNVPDFEKTLGAFGEMLIAMGALAGSIVWILKTLKSASVDKNSVDGIFKSLDSLKSTVSLSMGNVIATTVMILAIAKAIEVMSNALVNMSSLNSDLKTNLMSLGSIIGLLIALLEGMKRISNLKLAEGSSGKFLIVYAATLVIFAEAIKIMAQAFATVQQEMSKIGDLGGLMNALVSIGTIFGMLAAIVYAVNNIKIVNIQNLAKVGIGILVLAESVKILADAIKILEEVNAKDSLKGLVVVFTLLWEVFAMAGTIAGKSIGLKTSISFLAMASAIAILIHQIKTLATVPFDDIVKGFTTLVAMLGTFVITASFFQNELKSLSAAGFAMLEFAAALWVITKAINTLASVQPDQLAISLVSLIGTIASLTDAVSDLELDAKTGFAFLELGASLFIIAHAIKTLGEMDVFNILKGAGSFIIFLAGLLTIITEFGTLGTAGATALLEVAAALGILAISIAIIAPLGAVAAAVAVGILVFVAALGAVAYVASLVGAEMVVGAQAIAVALGLIGLGLLAVVAPIGLFALSMGLIASTAHQAADGLKAFVDALIQVTASAATNLTTMSRLGTIMLTVATAMVAGGASLIVMGVGLAAFGVGAVVAGAGATVLAGGLVLLAGALEYLISVLQAANLVDFAKNSGLVFGQMITQGTADGIKNGMPLVISALSAMLSKSIGEFNKEAGIASPSKVFAESGKFIDMGLAEGITENTDIVAAASKILGETTAKNINTELIKGTTEGTGQLKNSMTLFSDIVENGAVSAGTNVGVGFTKGLKAIAPKVQAYAANLAKSAMASMKSYLRIKSPSRLAMEIGEYTGEGFAIGMENTEGRVDDSAQDLGKTAEQSLTTALSAAYDNLTSGVEDPTIKPVLDLSEIQNGASSIDSMLSRDYASNIAANYKSDRDYQAEQNAANNQLLSGLNGQLLSAIASNNMSDLPINVNIQLVGDAEGLFRTIVSENQRFTKMNGTSLLLQG